MRGAAAGKKPAAEETEGGCAAEPEGGILLGESPRGSIREAVANNEERNGLPGSVDRSRAVFLKFACILQKYGV